MIWRIHNTILTVATVIGLAFPAGAAYAQDVTSFYRGKRLTLAIGYGPGGGYDLYARMLGRFIGAHIPGNPVIATEHARRSRGAANWLFKVAPRDGTVIACLSQATPTDQVLEEPGVQFSRRCDGLSRRRCRIRTSLPLPKKCIWE